MIGRRGGELWVWTAPMGGAAMIHASTSPRDDRAFERVDLDGIAVWFEQDMAIDLVTIGWTPLTGFDVTWPGTIHEDKSQGTGG